MEPASILVNGRSSSEDTGICRLKTLTAILIIVVVLSCGILQQVNFIPSPDTLPRSLKTGGLRLKQYNSLNAICGESTASAERLSLFDFTKSPKSSPETFEPSKSKSIQRTRTSGTFNTRNESFDMIKRLHPSELRNSTEVIRSTVNPKRPKVVLLNQCKNLFNTRNTSSRTVKRPPWFNLMKDLKSTDNSTEVQHRLYLTVESKGRLGNQLFEYASLFGIAWRNSRIPLWNKDPHGLRKIFKHLRINDTRKRNADQTTRTNWVTFINATERLPPFNIHIYGWLQHTRYFKHVDDQLRYDFTFSPDVIRQAQSMLDVFNASSLREKGYVRVVIHVRRGDLRYLVNRLLQNQTEFFNRSMAYFTDCLPKVHFIVISDDIPWCRKKIIGSTIDYIDGKRSPAVDLAIASLCDHAIITVGTFGWWAAWFANGVTVELTRQTEARRPPVDSKV